MPGGGLAPGSDLGVAGLEPGSYLGAEVGAVGLEGAEGVVRAVRALGLLRAYSRLEELKDILLINLRKQANWINGGK